MVSEGGGGILFVREREGRKNRVMEKRDRDVS